MTHLHELPHTEREDGVITSTADLLRDEALLLQKELNNKLYTDALKSVDHMLEDLADLKLLIQGRLGRLAAPPF